MSASDGASSNGGLSSTTYNFGGLWRGPLVLTDLDSGNKTTCTSEIKIAQPKSGFIIEYGTFNCEGQMDSWPRTELTLDKGKLYIGNQEVGSITTEKVSFTYVTIEAILQIEVTPQTLSTINLKVTYIDTANSQTYARLEGPLTRQ